MKLIKSSAVTMVGTGIGAIIGYFFNPVIVGPRLGPEGIAIVGTFISIYFFLSFPLTPLSMTLVRYVSDFNAKKKESSIASLVRQSHRGIILWGGLICCILLLLMKPVQTFLKLDSDWPVLAAILLFFLGMLAKAVQAPLQGLLRFGDYALLMVANPLVRLIVGFGLISWGFGAQGAVFAYLIGFLSVFLLGRFFLRDVLWRWPKDETIHYEAIFKFGLPVTFFAIYSNFVYSIDAIMAKHYFELADAGYYVAANTLGKLIFTVVTPLSVVSFSMMSNAISKDQGASGILTKTLALTVLGCIGFVGIFFLFPELIIRFTYGSQFQATIPILGLTALSMVPLCITCIYANYCLAKKQYSFIYGISLGAVIHVIAIVFYHNSLSEFVVATLIGGIAELVLGIAFSLKDSLRKK